MLTIAHVPNTISVRAALQPAQVDSLATLHVETRDPQVVSRITRAIETTKETPTDRGADLRYAIRIRHSRGVTTTIYMDAFGLRGVVDGRPVRFASDAIKRAIVEAYPQLAQ